MSLIFYDAAGVSGYTRGYVTEPYITKFSGSLTAHRLPLCAETLRVSVPETDRVSRPCPVVVHRLVESSRNDISARRGRTKRMANDAKFSTLTINSRPRFYPASKIPRCPTFRVLRSTSGSPSRGLPGAWDILRITRDKSLLFLRSLLTPVCFVELYFINFPHHVKLLWHSLLRWFLRFARCHKIAKHLNCNDNIWYLY